jgi:diguanylate cyclase (GGDEF)-like protein
LAAGTRPCRSARHAADLRQLTSELEAGQLRLAALADSAQRAQAMLRSILDSTIDGILVDNGDRRLLASNQRFRVLWSVPPTLDLTGDDEAMLEHLLDQLMYPAPFLYSRSLQYADGEEHRDLLRLKDGRFFEQITHSIELGSERARLWSFRDITERKQTEQRERSHRHVLELLARGASLHSILDAIVLGVETTNPGMICSVLLLDDDGHHLLVGSAPSLPDFFNEAVHGMQVEEGSGTCGTAVVTGIRVIAENIQVHPHWAEYRQVATRAGLASSWSEPIHGASGKILGTFAIYHREPHYPSPANVVLIEQASHLAGIAIEQGRAAMALRAGEERFRSLYDNAPVALWEQDWSAVREAVSLLDDGGVDDVADYLKSHPDDVARLARLVRINNVNGAALAQVGASEKDLAILSLAQNFNEAAMPQFIEAVAALAGGAQLHACESTFQKLDGASRNNEVTMLVMPGHAYALDFVIVSTIDITERKRMDAELLMLATTDFLTGLPNRREFMARLDDELARLQRQMDECAAVLMLDIDHFKRVNDEHGHAAGDAVLRHLAALMRVGQRKIDKLGRVGGEEFAILLPGANGDAALAYAERLRQSVASAPIEVDGKTLTITVSIGIASLNASDPSSDAALIRADKALYGAKEAGRNRVGNGLDVRVA